MLLEKLKLTIEELLVIRGGVEEDPIPPSPPPGSEGGEND